MQTARRWIIGVVNEPITTDNQFSSLTTFRQAAYRCLGRARDAQLDLTDAVLLTSAANSFAELSLSPVFRRKWPSVYEAIQDGCPDRAALLKLYLARIPTASRPVLAGDHTAWSRLSAPTLRDRSIQHQPARLKVHRPITVGHGYSTLAWIPQLVGSWANPLLHERVGSMDSPVSQGGEQLRRVCQGLAVRPISLWDTEYGSARFANETADIPADKIVRLRLNLHLRGVPPPYSGRGRRPIHGRRFRFKDPTTWGEPVETLETEHPRFGRVRVASWDDLHFTQAPQQRLVVARIERLDARGTRRAPQVMWLAWLGAEPPPLAEWWALYFWRFRIDHWYRFAKRRLYWTLPCFGTPEQAERWSDLMPFLSWELWLARQGVVDRPLPWQKAQAELTPGHVCQVMGSILAAIGTPACVPKTRGKAPGWQTGRPRKRRLHHPIVYKCPRRRRPAT